MKYTSTRSNIEISASRAILDGLSSDGGLYVPTTLPNLSIDDCYHLTYQELAIKILSLFFDEFSSESIVDSVSKAYNFDNFNHPSITGLRKFNDNKYFLELFYGKTSAFKDQALSIYPYLLKLAMQKHDIEHLTILAATSGDTGKAAMEALSNVDGLSIAVLYPEYGTSKIQKQQMQTQVGDNVLALAIEGNFDDAQRAVKDFFLKHETLNISSANSINIARLLPQVIYYYDLFVRLDPKKKVDIYVPTGNFGNILAAYIAKSMGLPINRLIVCTNENNVLYKFFTTGIYDINEQTFKVTSSPSMDILISSNLERLLYFMFNDKDKIKTWMKSLNEHKRFELSSRELKQLQEVFGTQMASDANTFKGIKDVFASSGILVDPHTATAIPQDPNNDNIQVIVSTASPYKFPTIYKDLFDLKTDDPYQILSEIELRSQEPYPDTIRILNTLDLRFKDVVAKKDVESTLLDYIKKEQSYEV